MYRERNFKEKKVNGESYLANEAVKEVEELIEAAK